MNGLIIRIGSVGPSGSFVPNRSIHIEAMDKQIIFQARAAERYRELHARTIATVRFRIQCGALTGRGGALLLDDAQVYRRMFASHNAALRRLRIIFAAPPVAIEAAVGKPAASSPQNTNARCDSFECVAAGVRSMA